jgi:hypothetical protein
MSEARKPIPFVTYDADGRIDMDLQCLKCGYNLRTLHDGGKCPECGVSISELARIGWLFQSDPAWLGRMARSTIWIGVAMICCILIMSSIVGYWGYRSDLLEPLAMLSIAVGSIAGLVGFSDFTAPHGDRDLRGGRIRRVARLMMALGTGGVFLMLLVPLDLNLYVISSSVGCLAVGAWATCAYAAELAARIPTPQLVKQVKIIRWGFAMCFLGCFLAIGETDPLREKLGAGASAGLLLLSIWTIRLLIWYRRRFREALKMSQPFADGHAAHAAR